MQEFGYSKILLVNDINKPLKNNLVVINIVITQINLNNHSFTTLLHVSGLLQMKLQGV